MDALNQLVADLASLAGVWKGEGRAEYPTITPTEYREETVFSTNGKDPVLHYEQRAWIKSADENNGQPVFWESGFFIARDGGSVELVSAQKSGRMEILRGNLSRSGESITISLESASIVNDERLIGSGRSYRINGDRLEYQLRMAMKKHPEYAIHLSATLRKTRPRP